MRSFLTKLLQALSKTAVGCCVLSALDAASFMMSFEEASVLDSIAPADGIGSVLDVPDVQKFTTSPVEEILFLSAILYFSQTHWTVWVNDKTYTADDMEDDNLKIIKVTNNHIELELKDVKKKSVRLRANQSLVTVGHYVIDGDARQKPKAVFL